jgi:uncharacterized membrane protein (DUF2068 family)
MLFIYVVSCYKVRLNTGIMIYLLETLKMCTQFLFLICGIIYLIIQLHFFVQAPHNFTMETLSWYSALAVVLVLASSTCGLKKEDCEGEEV